MSDCKETCTCTYISVILGVLFGAVFGVLYSLGFITVAIPNTIAFSIGLLGIFFTPLYSAFNTMSLKNGCFCTYKKTATIASIGTLVASLLTYVLFRAAVSAVATAIAIAVTGFFVVLLISTVVCITNKILCDNN